MNFGISCLLIGLMESVKLNRSEKQNNFAYTMFHSFILGFQTQIQGIGENKFYILGGASYF